MQGSHNRVVRRTALSAVMALVVAMLALLTLAASPAQATHFRANQLTWHKTTGNNVEFHITGAWRCTGFFANCLTSPPAAGTVIPNPGPTGLTTGVLNPGQGGTIAPMFTVVSVDTANDVVVGEAHAPKDYPGMQMGPFNVTFGECCRLSAPRHINNADKNMQVTSIVDLNQTSASPESSMSPVVDCKVNTICQFQVPAFDPDGHTLRYRMASSTEAAGTGANSGFVQPGPPNSTNAASIDATTGRYTWNTAGAQLNPNASQGTFYSTQVMVEELVGTVVVSKTAVDFFIRLNNTPNAAPVFVNPTPADATVINTTVGSGVTFNVAATDADVNDTVTLGMTNKPAAATFLSSSSNPATGTFSWTPATAGTTIVNLTAQDQSGLGAVQRSITINVANPSRNISVNDVTVNENAGTADFIVSLDSAAIGPISVQYLTFDGSAGEPGDYSLTQGTVNFAAGESSKTVSVPIIDDNNPEPTETFDFRIANPVGGVIVDGLGVGTITDTDRAISINDVSVDESAGTATFTVTLASAAAAPLSVDFTTVDGLFANAATFPSDYVTNSGTLNFVPTDLTKTVTVEIVDDNNPESTEHFEVRLAGATGGVITDGVGVGTITDTDRRISVNDNTMHENNGSLTFTVSLDAAAVNPVEVDYSTVDGSATQTGDYGAKAGSLTFAPGDITKSVTVTLTNDNIPEPTETFELKLYNNSGGVIDDDTGVGTILDSDRRISVNDVTVDESAGTATFTVSLDDFAVSPVGVDFATADGTATQPGDYTAKNGSLLFSAGQISKTVTVAIVDDNNPEPTEKFTLNLSNASDGVIVDGVGEGTITDEDRRISINDVTVDESAGTAMFLVTLDSPAVNPVTFNYATANGTATAGNDYVAKSGPAAFAPGQSTVSVVVTLIDDNTPEPTEKFEVRLSNVTGGVLDDGTGEGTITDADRRISVNDVTVDESAGTATFKVTLDDDAVNPVTVNYATANGTATAPGDYTAKNGTLTFAAGEDSKDVTVTIVDDVLPEPTEKFTVNLSGASGGVIDDGVGEGTITDTDRSISVNDVTVNEAAGTATFRVSLNSPATAVVQVDYATANGSATQPSDYAAASGNLTFAAGEQHKDVSVVIVNDTADEPTETFQLKLSNAVGGGIVDDTGVGTIIDNDRNGAFYCRATGIRYTSEAVVANAPGTPCADDTKSALTVPLGPITAALVNGKTDQTPNSLIGTQPVNGDSAAAHSDTATVNVVLGAVSLRVTAVVSDAKATCKNGEVVLSGSSSVSGLKLGNNLPYGVLRSYLKIAVPGILSLEVNKQTKVGGKLIQQALVITLLNGTPIVIGEAIAGADGNPCVV